MHSRGKKWKRQKEGAAATHWRYRREMMCLFYILGQMTGCIIAAK